MLRSALLRVSLMSFMIRMAQVTFLPRVELPLGIVRITKPASPYPSMGMAHAATNSLHRVHNSKPKCLKFSRSYLACCWQLLYFRCLCHPIRGIRRLKFLALVPRETIFRGSWIDRDLGSCGCHNRQFIKSTSTAATPRERFEKIHF